MGEHKRIELQVVVRHRRMERNFADSPIPRQVVDRILDNALHAPSAGFSQGWAFLVFEGAEETARFWNATFPESKRETFKWRGMFNAPLVIVPLSSMDAYLDRYA